MILYSGSGALLPGGSAQTAFADVLHSYPATHTTPSQESEATSALHSEVRALREENAALHEEIARLRRLRNQDAGGRHMMHGAKNFEVTADLLGSEAVSLDYAYCMQFTRPSQNDARTKHIYL